MADKITSDEITLDELPLLQHVALARLHLKLTGDVHALLIDLLDKLNSKLLQHTDKDGVIDPIASNVLTDFIAIAWREYFSQYELRFRAARREAAGIALAALGYQHQHFAGLVNEEASERRQGRGRLLTEQTGVEPFFELLQAEVLKTAEERVYSDGFKLSQRIWNLDQAGLGGIQQVVMETVATGDSAWNAAKRLEGALGAGQECTRWTSTRLYKTSKADIAAGDETGLLRASGDSPCASKGVAYNALRLARNEIQIAHNAMTDAAFGNPRHSVGGGERLTGLLLKSTCLRGGFKPPRKSTDFFQDYYMSASRINTLTFCSFRKPMSIYHLRVKASRMTLLSESP